MRQASISAGVWLMLTLAACGQSADIETKTAAPTTTAGNVDCAEDSVAFTFDDQVGFNTSVNLASAAVIGTFVAVPPPKKTGTDFVGNATLKVERVIFDSPEAIVKTGEEFPVRLMAQNACGVESYSEVAGQVASGMRSLVLLYPVKVTDSNGQRRTALTIQKYSNWRLERDESGREHGRSFTAERDAPVETIERRIREERSAGRNTARDRGTEQRPFG